MMKKSELRQIIKEEIKNILEYTWNKQNYLKYIRWAEKKKLDPFSQDTVDMWKKLNETKNELREIVISELDSTELWTKYHAQQETKPKIFDIDSVKNEVSKMNAKIKAPYVKVNYSDLGGAIHVSIYILVSLDDKKDWYNGILENSRYFRMSLSNDGILQLFSGSHLLRSYKFRKTKVKSVDDAITKINNYIQLASKGDK